MTDFHGPTEDHDTDYDELIDLVRRNRDHRGTVDRLSYDLDGDGHFDLVKVDDNVD